jgi:formylglycine-generating enzyme required for sulfatase activity
MTPASPAPSIERGSGASTWGNDPDRGMTAEQAWFDRNSRQAVHPAGQKKPNPSRLYDMSGNVLGLCQDYGAIIPPRVKGIREAPESGSNRVSRGGSWNSSSGWRRSAFCEWYSPHKWNGSQLVREVK